MRFWVQSINKGAELPIYCFRPSQNQYTSLLEFQTYNDKYRAILEYKNV